MAIINSSSIAKRMAAYGLSAAAALSGGYLLIPNEGAVLNSSNEYVVYLDPVGIPTACWGLTGKDMYGKPFKKGNTYTEQECTIMFVDRVRHFERVVDKYVRVPYASVYEKAALISFVYNVGEGNFSSSSLLKALNKGQHEVACDGLLAWKYAKKRVLPGLVKRRAEERQWCLGEVPQDVVVTFNDIVKMVKDTKESSSEDKKE